MSSRDTVAPLKERRLVLKEGERLHVVFALADGTQTQEYALVEHRPPGYRTGDGRSGPGSSGAVGAVAMKFSSGNGSYQTLRLNVSSPPMKSAKTERQA